MRSWLSVLIADARSKKRDDIPIAPSLYSLSNKMDNSLLAVRDINHKYIVVEKRKMELIEIKEKNRLLVNTFSQCYINALETLLNEYSDFELLQVLYKEYKNQSKDGIDYTSINVENNSAHYLYSRTYDRIYISLNYNPAHGDDKYCNLTISYNISSPSVSRTFRVKFAENNTMVCEIDDDMELLNVATIIKVLNIIVEDYISE
jgi:hypothetical protein